MRHAVAVLAELLKPGAGPASRPELAARVTGSAHGLDDGAVVAQLALRALALHAGCEPPAGAAARRELGKRYGVASDSVSSTCLALGVLARGCGPAARRLALAAEAGDPVHLTPRDLRRLEFARHAAVLVCENPRVLEAVADRLDGLLPVVCVAGQPKVIALDLLRRLAGTGAVLRYHGDFDWPGIAIANRLVAEAGAVPWRMHAADYEAAASRSRAVLGLVGSPVSASWDPGLSPAMTRLGVAVHEEAVLPELLAAAEQLGRKPAEPRSPME